MRAIALVLGLVLAASSYAATNRSASAKAAFQRLYHCPATDKPRGPCPGYIIDHIEPLCAGGADTPANMQWQSAAEAKIKDRQEAKQCAALRRSKK